MKGKLWKSLLVALLGISLPQVYTRAQAVSGDLVPQFTYIAQGWLPVQAFQMDPFWHAFGYPESGINYYTLGGPKDANSPYWERFNPDSPTYQCFVGTYVVTNFQFAAEWDKPRLRPADITQSVQRVIELNIADYFAWNSAYGAPTATTVIPGTLKVLKGDNGWFNIFAMTRTYSDLGAVVPWFPWVPPYTLWQNQVEPYQPIILEAAERIKYDKVHQNLLVLYGNAVHYELRDGTHRNTPFATILEIGRMMAGVKYE